jgi:Gram-negative porin
MQTAVRAGAAILAAGLAWMMPERVIAAASDVNVGGYHDIALRAAQRNLLAGAPEATDAVPLQITIGSGPSSAVTAFTPRFGGLGFAATGPQAARPVGRDALGRSPESPQVRQFQLDLGGGQIGDVPVGLAAIAEMSDASASTGSSGLAVGGELAVSGLRFGASYGEDAALLGLDGTRMTAGVAYGFGPLDTRMSYSVVDRETAVDTSLFTLGSRLTLTPGLVVQGDVAYAGDQNGDAATAGRVSLRFNF